MLSWNFQPHWIAYLHSQILAFSYSRAQFYYHMKQLKKYL